MDAVSARAARDLFAHEKRISEASLETGSSEDSIFEFHATFIELLGKRAVDLLDPEKKEVVINEDKVFIAPLVWRPGLIKMFRLATFALA